jgi:hypothetical protein
MDVQGSSGEEAELEDEEGVYKLGSWIMFSDTRRFYI